MSHNPKCPLGFSNRFALLRWTKAFMMEHDLRPIESLGQNFLVDPRGIDLFLRSMKEARGRDFVEVGCGLGILTVNMASLAGKIVCIELDAGLARASHSIVNACQLDDTVQVVRGDGLEHVKSTRLSVLYSNPAFNIATQLIIEIIKNNHIKNAIISLQSEVARKLLASPGHQDYGRLTVITRFFFNVEWKGLMPKSWFWPKPKVDAAVVRLTRINVWSNAGEVLEKILRCIFPYKNKRASKIVGECLSTIGCDNLTFNWLNSKRIRDLTLSDIKEILGAAMECIDSKNIRLKD